MSETTGRNFTLLSTDRGQAAFQELLSDPRIVALFQNMDDAPEIGQGVVAAAFLRASEPAQTGDRLDQTFTGAALSADEAIVEDARTAIREYAAMVAAPLHPRQ